MKTPEAPSTSGVSHHSTVPAITDQDTGLRGYLNATLGTTEGWLTVLVGYGGYFDAAGTYSHRETVPRCYQWPAEADRAVQELTQMAHLGDVWACPYVMTNAARRKGESVVRPIVHADVDGSLDWAKVTRFPGVFVVGSGREGHAHVYVPLSKPVTVQQHKALEEGLRDYLGGDDKITDNDLLRPIGTLNHKLVPTGGDPSPVTWLIRPTGVRADTDVVAAMLGVTLPDENATAPSAAVPAMADQGVREPVDIDAHPAIRTAVDLNTRDRSKDTMRIVGACVDSGVRRLPQILSVIDARPDLVGRLATHPDDVARCLEKVRASRPWLPRAGDTPAGDDLHEKHSGQVRMAFRLAKSYGGRLLYVHGLGWHWWDGTRWAFDDSGRAASAVVDVLQQALTESLNDKVLRRDVQRCESHAGLAGVLGVASALPHFAATVRDMDADPYLFNVANGTVDLRMLDDPQTRGLRPHSPADRLTKVARGAYRPDVESELWKTFLARVLPDAEVRGFLQRYAGLGLLGAVREHVLVIGTGTGANGKSKCDGAIRFAYGDYAITAEPELFMHRENAHPTGEMDLRGVRWVSVSESERDRRLAETGVKRLTGGDNIRARRMRQDYIEFVPSHTAFLITNYLPKVSGDDAAIWRRLRVVPYDVVIPDAEQDGELGEKLELEADGIITWAIAGYRDYVARGLDEPDAVLGATGDYQKASDAVARFIDECCLIGSELHKSTTEPLFEAWERWRTTDGAEHLSLKAFGQALTQKGYPADKPTNGKKWRQKITLRPVEKTGSDDE